MNIQHLQNIGCCSSSGGSRGDTVKSALHPRGLGDIQSLCVSRNKTAPKASIVKMPGAATLHWGGDLCKGEVILAKNEGATWGTEGVRSACS